MLFLCFLLSASAQQPSKQQWLGALHKSCWCTVWKQSFVAEGTAQPKELQWISQLCAWLCWGLPSALVQLGVTVCKSLVWVHAFEPMLQGAVRTAWAVGLCQVPTRWWEWLLKLSPPCSHIQVSSSWDSDCNYHNKQICVPLAGPCPHECGTACASQGT